MAVNMKRSRESTTALVREVCEFTRLFTWFLVNLKTFKAFPLPQWRYDHTTATYLLLLSKKQRGKPVRLCPQPAVYDSSCSPLHQGQQVRLWTTPWYSTYLELLPGGSSSGADSLHLNVVVDLFFFMCSFSDTRRISVQRGWRCCNCGFFGLLLRLHWWLPLGFSLTAYTPGGQRSAGWKNKQRHGTWELKQTQEAERGRVVGRPDLV